MRRMHAFVTGKVQGVWFRKNTMIESNKLGLTGFVRNLKDGRVECVAEGPQQTLQVLLEWLNTGPPLARVVDVAVSWSDATGEFQGFRVA